MKLKYFLWYQSTFVYTKLVLKKFPDFDDTFPLECVAATESNYLHKSLRTMKDTCITFALGNSQSISVGKQC